ncbi:hypothetical protein [Prosthecomicrobium hirschii]|uniref:hypothetical protein n=1 Tax=Prosthecodimorpha hirschii TaxID=665126 RepID=UPI00221FB91A|nr:hypothetical protein [Prosthecomicrobium hirschii]MCW1844164.1 hypothetical protein [Prosthecomicrobium hirschii]
MTISISFGWWLLPLAVTIGLHLGWRLFGVREQPRRGSMFPDLVGGMVEVGGYLLAALLSIIAWLVWAIAA